MVVSNLRPSQMKSLFILHPCNAVSLGHLHLWEVDAAAYAERLLGNVFGHAEKCQGCWNWDQSERPSGKCERTERQIQKWTDNMEVSSSD